MMARPKCVLCALLMILVAVTSLSVSNLQVRTRFGIIQGRLSRSARGRSIVNFLGIPYAYPPIGELRFRSPVAWNLTWDSPFYALSDSLMCAQVNSKGIAIGREDCLYLNIFVPLVSDDLPPGNKLPVMVYIHGGAFNSGSSDSNKFSPKYLLDQNVVLVTMNYRLNALGFFSTTNRASPGNYGLKDILTVLRWVNENIGDFGGDPNRVTLFGHSAGATAAHMLTLSENARGLFHRVILQGGSALVTLGLHSHQFIRESSIEMARIAGCRPPSTTTPPTESSTTEYSNETQTTTESHQYAREFDDDPEDVERDEEMMECMRTVSAKDLLLQRGYYPIWRGNPFCVFGPTLEEPSEDAVLTVHPLAAIRNHRYDDLPMIFGVVEDEGLVKTDRFYADPQAEEEMIGNFELYLPYVLENHEIVRNYTVFSKAMEEFYFDGDISTGFRRNITELVGDALITWPVYRAATLHSGHANSSIYFYRFSYEGTFTETFRTGIPVHYGVAHGDEMNYLFPKLNYKFSDQLLHNTEDDTTMINVMTEMWAAFAAHGVPKAWLTPTWPNFAETGEIMRFGLEGSPDLKVDDDFLPERMAFWDDVTSTLLDEGVEDDDPMPCAPDDLQYPTDFAPTFNSNNFLLSTLVIVTLGTYRKDLP